ncbi:LemA family protein [Tenggerimyces flavus]|uniref:LemA family protein n=1 Tax=Tenggerimyces flavus TaxID=1708749 RepID=A0ABV7YJU1_9ACTN|nr:LemA family protein [Tenggerimyces flavus]MBM7784038.1 LemA protein [Tenggerimyces flavus]
MTWIIIAIVVVVVLLLIGVVVSYNRFVSQRNLVQESWRQIDVELHRRYDLIPNLVETVKGYASHEQSIFNEVARLRSAATAGDSGSSLADRASAETALSAGLRQLFAVVENYPDLKANSNFGELQRHLAETEDRIAAGRRFYNANVRAYNTRVESVPSNIIASTFKFAKAEYFEVEEAEVRAAPTVDFGTPAAGQVPPSSPPPPAVES